ARGERDLAASERTLANDFGEAGAESGFGQRTSPIRGGAIYARTSGNSSTEPGPSTGRTRGRRPFAGARGDARDSAEPSFEKKSHDDRTPHLEYAERPQDQRCARGNGSALQGRPDQHHQGRTDGAFVPGDQPKQQDTGHRRS